jgi:hypothetical protein
MKYLVVIVTILGVGLIGCKKNGNKPAMTGKWQETRLNAYMLDSAGKVSHDTTYLEPTLTSADYIEFYNNNTCTVSSSHLYYPAGYGFTRNGPYPSAAKYNIISEGAGLVLNPVNNIITPGGFVTTDTLFNYANNTILLRSFFYGHSLALPASVSDGYYTK